MAYEKKGFDPDSIPNKGKFIYCGISKNPSTRVKYHAGVGRTMVESVTGLSWNEARALEQKCIEVGDTTFKSVGTPPNLVLGNLTPSIGHLYTSLDFGIPLPGGAIKNKNYYECSQSWATKVFKDLRITIPKFGEVVDVKVDNVLKTKFYSGC
jgi:hypothetical protein